MIRYLYHETISRNSALEWCLEKRIMSGNGYTRHVCQMCQNEVVCRGMEVCRNSVCKDMICSKQSERDWNDVRVPQMLWNGQPHQVGYNEYLVIIERRTLLMLEKRRVRKNRVLVFQEKRSYTHLNDNSYSEKFPLKQMELGGKSMRKSKMRNRGKDRSII